MQIYLQLAFSRECLDRVQLAIHKYVTKDIMDLLSTKRAVFDAVGGDPSKLVELLQPLDVTLAEVVPNLEQVQSFYAAVHTNRSDRLSVLPVSGIAKAQALYGLLHTSDTWETRSSKNVQRDKQGYAAACSLHYFVRRYIARVYTINEIDRFRKMIATCFDKYLTGRPYEKYELYDHNGPVTDDVRSSSTRFQYWDETIIASSIEEQGYGQDPDDYRLRRNDSAILAYEDRVRPHLSKIVKAVVDTPFSGPASPLKQLHPEVHKRLRRLLKVSDVESCIHLRTKDIDRSIEFYSFIVHPFIHSSHLQSIKKSTREAIEAAGLVSPNDNEDDRMIVTLPPKVNSFILATRGECRS